MTTGELIGRIYDLSENKLMRMAVEIKEHPQHSKIVYHDFPAVKAAFEKVLAIRDVERKRVCDYYHASIRYPKVGSDKELRDAYNFQRLMKKPGEKHYSEALAISLKRTIREYTQAPSACDYRRIVKDYGGDGYIELVMLPDFDTIAAAEDWFKYRYYLEAPRSAFDCTGRCFTVWYKLFQRRGNWWAYHRVAVDC